MRYSHNHLLRLPLFFLSCLLLLLLLVLLLVLLLLLLLLLLGYVPCNVLRPHIHDSRLGRLAPHNKTKARGGGGG